MFVWLRGMIIGMEETIIKEMSETSLDFLLIELIKSFSQEQLLLAKEMVYNDIKKTNEEKAS
jgi:hypothetical protein